MEERIISTVVGVVAAIVVASVVFIGANKWFDQASNRWKRFGAITGAVTAGLVSLVLLGNGVIAWKTSGADDATDLTWLLVLLYAALGAAFGFLLNSADERPRRLLIGGVGGLVVAGSLGAFVTSESFLAPKTLDVIVWPVVGAVVFAAVKKLRDTKADNAALIPSLVTGAGVGWVIGSWGFGAISSGTRLEATVGFALAGLALGLRLALADQPDKQARDRIQGKSRAFIFLTPALAFIAMTLIIPTISTLLLSFKDDRAEEWLGLENYGNIFTNPIIFNIDNIGGIFTSGLTIAGVVAVAIGLFLAVRKGASVGVAREWSGSSIGFLAAGVILFLNAVFTTLRGTFWNNLWWVAAVTTIATSLGLAVAVLSDRAKGETVAKSLIFMPMAISFVGAGIIWRFVYIPRPASVDQTGVLNTLWVGLGRATAERNTSFWILVALIAGLAGFAAYVAIQSRSEAVRPRRNLSLSIGALFAAVVVVMFIGVGGGGLNEAGEFVGEPYLFLETRPWNNFWLMVVLIWIQTGFAMVVLSAAIKGVPTDLIEASKVDGATESETFWRVIIPQVSSTIVVVTTTLIVLVMKVFDIPKVMTAGQFETNVLANEMFQQAFTNRNRGLGAAVAIVLFLMVLPVMVYNIRRDAEAA